MVLPAPDFTIVAESSSPVRSFWGTNLRKRGVSTSEPVKAANIIKVWVSSCSGTWNRHCHLYTPMTSYDKWQWLVGAHLASVRALWEHWGVNACRRSPQPMPGGGLVGRCHLSCLSWDTLKHVLHHLPGLPWRTELQLPIGNCLICFSLLNNFKYSWYSILY